MCDLVTNFEHHLHADKKKYAEVAFKISQMLLDSGIFMEFMETERGFLHVATMCFCHILQLICNGHAITVMRQDACDLQVESFQEVKIATAVFANTSLLNHSCQPNITAKY